MKITRENYEIFLIDYLDENLDAESNLELESFLEENPDIKEEMDGLQSYCLKQTTVSFPNKEDLLQSEFGVTETERLLVGELERDLTADEQNQLLELKRNRPELERDTKLFGFTKLKADLSLRFADKATLKRQQRILPLWSYAAAASIVLAITAGMLFWDTNSSLNTQTASDLESEQVLQPAESSTYASSATANSNDQMLHAQIEEAPELAYQAVATFGARIQILALTPIKSPIISQISEKPILDIK